MDTKSELVIIDYGMGNLRSVQRKCERVGSKVTVSANPAIIARADKLILPGVGHFANGVQKLKESGIWDTLNHKVLVEKTPILGICLGMQLMARHSEEGNVDGLGWFDAEVVHFRVSNKRTFKVPHMGWNNAALEKDSKIFGEVPENAMFYFVHSYHFNCHQASDVLAVTTYDYPFVSAIERENIFGTQFHPEKSHDWGEKLIRNFIEKT